MLPLMAKHSDGHFSEGETIARAEAALKRMLATPPKPHSEMRLGKSKAKAAGKAKSPKKRGRPSKKPEET